ncbi:MAG TPA: 30S ribosomal protein S1, partial [Terriglobales bacterium]
LAIDPQKRQIRLSMKSLVPTGLDEFIAEKKPGDPVTGRIVDISGSSARVELGEGITATCTLPASAIAQSEAKPAALDLSALTSMLNARWKGSDAASRTDQSQAPQAGQVRTFRIRHLDPAHKAIEVELA